MLDGRFGSLIEICIWIAIFHFIYWVIGYFCKLIFQIEIRYTKWGSIVVVSAALIMKNVIIPSIYNDIQSERQLENELSSSLASLQEEVSNVQNLEELSELNERSDELTDEFINSVSDDAELQYMAASSFMGFYLVEQRITFDYCSALGVDISPFVESFTEVNRLEYDRAQQVIFEHGIDSIEQEFINESARDEFEPQVFAMMDLLAEDLQITNTELCELYRDEASIVAQLPMFSFANNEPELREALMR